MNVIKPTRGPILTVHPDGRWTIHGHPVLTWLVNLEARIAKRFGGEVNDEH